MSDKQAPDPDFNAFVGAETGLLKGVSVSAKGCIAKNFKGSSGKQLDKQEEITCLEWANGHNEVLVGSKNRIVRVFDPKDKAFAQSIDCTVAGEADGPLRGVARLDGVLVTAAESGSVKVWKYPDSQSLCFNTIDVEVEKSRKLKQGDFDSEEARLKHLATLKAERHLCRMRAAPGSPNIIATGGRENDVQIWDLSKPDAPIFRGRNVPLNFLQLRVPVWVSDVCFPDATTTALVAAVNRHGHVRLYDTRISGQRRPVHSLDFDDSTLTAISATPDPNQVLVGTTTGQLGMFDFRKERKGLFRKYKGCVGSIRSIDCSRETGYFAAVGLDRFMRIFHVQSKKMFQKSYLKSRLNCVLLNGNFDPTKSEEERAADALDIAGDKVVINEDDDYDTDEEPGEDADAHQSASDDEDVMVLEETCEPHVVPTKRKKK